jgi:hypothetical protein
MTYDQGDVNVIYQQVLAENNVPQDQVESFTKQYGAQIREEVIFRAMTNKVTDLLIENAQITVGMPGEGAEKKKKPAAKGEKAEAKPSKTTKDATKKAPKK